MITDSPAKTTKLRTLLANGKNALRECRQTFKEGGFKAVVQRYGWKIFAVFFLYYLVRDLTLYVLIPYIVAKHFIN